MTEEEQKSYRDAMLDIRIKQAYYIMEHKESSPELEKELNALKREFTKKVYEDMIRKEDNNDDQYKRK